MTRCGWVGLVVSFIVSWSCCACLWGRPTTAQQAERVVAGWLKADREPLGMSLGRHVRRVDTFADDNGEPLYYIVYLQASGFVIVSADDLVEPIIGFVQGDRFDASPENPLGALVTADLTSRIAAVRAGSTLRITAGESFERDAQSKWRQLMDLGEGPKDRIVATALGIPSISDVRVAPLVKSKWDQVGVTLTEDCELACYNYYTPPFTTPDGDPCNYPCGCPATALAQLLCYYEYPTTGIGVHEFMIRVDGVQQRAFTRGGDGSGGAYDWDMMPYEPNCTTTEGQRQAVGALCYDAGISMNQGYSAKGSGWSGCSCDLIARALTTTFTYANAVHGYNSESPIGRGLIGMINPNLDAKKPVILSTIPHAFVCDGYGYDFSTLYHHLNIGWLGVDDVWYDLTTAIYATTTKYDVGIVCSCVYNTQTIRAGDGEIVSGRVLDQNGGPIANTVLYVKSGGETIAETETDCQGIYAFDCLQSNTTYTVNAALKGYGFNRQRVTTGISKDNSITSGNIWGADLVGLLGDFNGDQIVDMRDLSTLAQHWGQDESSVDVAPGPSGDHVVDYRDLGVLAEYWLKKVPLPPQPGLVAHWKLDEASGTVAADTAGTNNATLVGDPVWQPTDGKLGGALQLDGVDDYASTGCAPDPSAVPFSVFAWIKGGGPGQVILSQEKGSNWLMAGAGDGALSTELKDRGTKALASLTIITDGEWHHVGVALDSTSRMLYVDGVQAAAGTQVVPPGSTRGLYIGAGSTLTPGSFWSGLIDDVRIYNRAVKP